MCPSNTAPTFGRNVAKVANCWQRCVWFGRPELWTSDLPLQRRTRNPSTSLPVKKGLVFTKLNFDWSSIAYCILNASFLFDIAFQGYIASMNSGLHYKKTKMFFLAQRVANNMYIRKKIVVTLQAESLVVWEKNETMEGIRTQAYSNRLRIFRRCSNLSSLEALDDSAIAA